MSTNEHATAQQYGRLLGMLSGLFALLQVLVSASSAHANLPAISALQHSYMPCPGDPASHCLTGVPSGFNSLVAVLVMTYLSAIVAGLIMMGFAWYAGRLTAFSIGRREFGGQAGFWVALWSGGIWLALSLVATLLTHADGTITGIFTSSTGTSQLAAEVILLLLQNGFAALIGLGLGALAGLIGAHSAPVGPSAPLRVPPASSSRRYPPYSAYPAIADPASSPGYWPPSAAAAPQPPAPPSASPGVYPPPPEWYQRREWAQGEQTSAATGDRGLPG